MRIKPYAVETIKALIQTENLVNSKVTYYTNVADYAPKTIEPKDVIMLPNVMFWDPLNNLPISLYCPHCHQDKKVMNPVRAANTWYISSKSHQPRMLWERGWNCALVGKAYFCNNKHFVVSYHTGFLTQIPDDRIPFLLTHLTGMTKACYDLVIKLFEHGNSFTSIQQILEGMFLDTFERKRLSFPQDSIPDLENIAANVPSEGITKQYFIVQHEGNKDTYQSQMDKIPFTRLYISTNKNYFDVNIGVKENISAKKVKWLKLFDTMFLVFNEDGCVKAYGLTNGVCIEQLVQCLLALAPFNPDTELISMNGFCCDARNSLIESFPNATITYGLDCAKDLLKESIKTTDEKHEIMKDLDAIFQVSKNVGVDNQILSHLDSFIVKWSKESDQTSSMFEEAFYNDVETLKFHICNGCLSNEPQKSFAKEEREIFKQFGNIFKSRFIGVQPACAMIAHIVYVYNCHRLGQVRHQPIWIHRPLQLYQIKGEAESEISQESQESSNATIEVLNESSAGTVVDENESSAAAIAEIAEDEEEIKEPKEELDEDIVTLSPECQQTISIARLCHKISTNLKKVPKIHQSYISVVVNVWDNHSYLKTCYMHRSNKDELNVIMRMLGLKCLPSPMTNFSSLVFSLTTVLKDLAEQESTPKSFVESFESKGMHSESKVAMESLQQFLSKELVGEHESLYDDFLVLNKKIGFAKDAGNMKLLKSEVDIAMIHAASNIFGVSFVLIPTCREVPVLPVLPSQNFQDCLPCFVTFDPDTGEFNACTREKDHVDPYKKPQGTVCACGSKGKKNNAKKYGKKCKTMRCYCFTAGNKCSSSCGCVTCGNGKPVKELQDPDPEPPPKKKVKRRSRHYDFLAETATMVESGEIPIPMQLPDSGPTHSVPVEEVKTVIPASDMHHCFLDALLFILITEHPSKSKETRLGDDDLPDLLHGSFLMICEELMKASAAQEGDNFLEFLSSMDFSFVEKWVTEGKRLYRLLKDLKSVITTQKIDGVKKGNTVTKNEKVEKDSNVDENKENEGGEERIDITEGDNSNEIDDRHGDNENGEEGEEEETEAQEDDKKTEEQEGDEEKNLTEKNAARNRKEKVDQDIAGEG